MSAERYGRARGIAVRVTVGGLCAIALAAGLMATSRPDPASGVGSSEERSLAAPLVPPSVYSVRRGDLLYTYHPLTDTEALFDLRSDPQCRRNLAPSRESETVELRDALIRELGVANLRVRPLPAQSRAIGS